MTFDWHRRMESHTEVESRSVGQCPERSQAAMTRMNSESV
jgi:hypothetical protein